MIDTVKLRSPYLTAEVAALVEQQLTRRSAVKLASGEVLYEVTSGELEGSFDNRIMVRLCREELAEAPGVRGSVAVVALPKIDPRLLLHPDPKVQAERQRVAAFRDHRPTGVHRPIFRNIPCQPYLLIEASVHKAMLGHNITGGPQNFRAAACWLVNEVAAYMLAVSLPHGDDWIVERVDVTETYQLPFAAIQEYIGSLNRLEFPRRKRRSYGLEALQFSGTTTTFSLYHKGPEFAVHDGKKLRGRFGPVEMGDLQELANGIMRMEVQVKAKKLRADVESGLLGVKGEKLRVVQVTDAYLGRVHDAEVARVIREGHKDMTTVRLEREVYARLTETHGGRLAAPLYALWVRLAAHGEKEARRDMKRSTFYLQRKQLVQAGCSWAGTDIVIKHSCIPVGFNLRRSDPRRDTVEDVRVTELLARWREAA
jgi:hypothetical protein